MATQSTKAYEKLKDMIFRMELLPGNRISEMNIASQLNLSRTPVHDAVRRLAADGLVTLESNRSAVVVDFSENQITEIGTVRMAQDILSAELASYYGSAANFAELEILAQDCIKAAKEGNVYCRILSDIKFHLKIAEISGSDHLLQQQRAIYQQIHLIQITKYTDIEASLSQIKDHMPLIEAIKNGDISRIKYLTCLHLKDFYQISPYILKCYGYEE